MSPPAITIERPQQDSNLRRGLRRAAFYPTELWGLGASDGVRTHDIQLGKLALYQLSYTCKGDVALGRANLLINRATI